MIIIMIIKHLLYGYLPHISQRIHDEEDMPRTDEEVRMKS